MDVVSCDGGSRAIDFLVALSLSCPVCVVLLPDRTRLSLSRVVSCLLSPCQLFCGSLSLSCRACCPLATSFAAFSRVVPVVLLPPLAWLSRVSCLMSSYHPLRDSPASCLFPLAIPLPPPPPSPPSSFGHHPARFVRTRGSSESRTRSDGT